MTDGHQSIRFCVLATTPGRKVSGEAGGSPMIELHRQIIDRCDKQIRVLESIRTTVWIFPWLVVAAVALSFCNAIVSL